MKKPDIEDAMTTTPGYEEYKDLLQSTRRQLKALYIQIEVCQAILLHASDMEYKLRPDDKEPETTKTHDTADSDHKTAS